MTELEESSPQKDMNEPHPKPVQSSSHSNNHEPEIHTAFIKKSAQLYVPLQQ